MKAMFIWTAINTIWGHTILRKRQLIFEMRLQRNFSAIIVI